MGTGGNIELDDFLDMSKFSSGGHFDPTTVRPMVVSGECDLSSADLNIAGHVFIPRTPTQPDWDEDDLTIDLAYHTLDLSSIIPASNPVPTAVLVESTIKDNEIQKWIEFRAFGSTSEGARLYTQTANIKIVGEYEIALSDTSDGKRKIEYKVDTPGDGWSQIDIKIIGWYG